MSVVYILIPLCPLLASVTIALAGRRLGEASRKVGVAAMAVSFAVSVAAFVDLVVRQDPVAIPLYEWLRSGDLVVGLGLYVDQLTVLLLLLVTGVSLVVHVYAGRYMTGDLRYGRFFALTTLFTFAMVSLVMSRNLLMMFMSWEIMGVCSYLLISHQADRPAACKAATKAFLVNAVADVGFLFGIILTFATFQTLDIPQILEQAPGKGDHTVNLLSWAGYDGHVHTLTLITLFLFVGCLGKSAQLPFHAWLPHAMEAPTPVSALIHAATMVNAGPFLLVRFSPLVMLSPVAMTVIAVIGGATALFAAVVSLTQSDIKKILAYSTISQIGFMIFTCGLGAFAVAIFHMLAHGFLKGFLFLSTGNQLEAVASHRHHGPAGHSRPSWALYLGALILACVPPFVIFSEPYESLWTAQNSPAAGVAFWAVGLLTVFFTAIYLLRGVTALFGPRVAGAVGPRFFSPPHLLAVSAGTLAMVGALVALWQWFVPFLTPALAAPVPTGGAWRPAGAVPWVAFPLLAAFGGWAFAFVLQRHPGLFSISRTGWGKAVYVLCLNKFYFDELYSASVVRPTLAFSRWTWRVVDVGGIDRLIHGTASGSVLLSRWMWRIVDVRVIDRLIHGLAGGSVALARWLWRVVDVRGIDRASVESGRQSVSLARWLWASVDVRRLDSTSDQIARAADATSQKLQEVEPRTLQHHLLSLIFWLVAAIVLFYWLVL